jgi:hypothetical protein
LNVERISHFIQILSGIALIVGIILVLAEMRQTKALVQAQLQSDFWEGAANRSIAQMGENAPNSIARACKGEELTAEDIVVLENKYQLHMTLIIRQKVVNDIAQFDSDAWERTASGQFLQVFSTVHGRTWWKSARQIYAKYDDGNLIQIGDRVLADASDLQCMGFETTTQDKPRDA